MSLFNAKLPTPRPFETNGLRAYALPPEGNVRNLWRHSKEHKAAIASLFILRTSNGFLE
jgi:hypothetical protein